ncbi:DMT family transporter [Chitinimonas sp. BJYL2]|uniref:DMT family transporter n=1 Tax=Chitinimonas sp. BJYL2 TaxID=2976696 RepID=UPI0022B38D24|nr:EamA family transporter [Chitinimonas sp. BJYL2]
MSNLMLYAIATLIWGSTWLAITFQLGTVPVTASVAYRFLIAAVIVLAWAAWRGDRLRLRVQEWQWAAAQGALMFGISYMLVYAAEAHIASGLVAVLNSTMVVMNLIGMRLAFGRPIERKSLLGAALGLAGIVLVFWPELQDVQGRSNWTGIACGLLAAVVASAGNIVAQHNRNLDIPLLPGIGIGMLTGGLASLAYTLLSGESLRFDWRPAYLLSLAYLAIFGSVLAFASYLTLMGRIGAARAGYIAIAVPIVALVLSTLFEGFNWQWLTVFGILCAAAGNVIMLNDVSSWLRRLGMNRLAAHLS